MKSQGISFQTKSGHPDSKFTYETFQKENNKGADQTAQMPRLVCACVVHNAPKTGFLAMRPKCNQLNSEQKI